MSFGLPPSAFSESDLHGLVDGQLEPGRQADIVERLKGHSQLRGHVAAWKEQNDLLRATFSEIENEAIPTSLSLTQPPKLKCVTSENWSMNRAAPMTLRPVPPASTKRRHRGVLGLGAVVGCVGVIGGWFLAQHADPVATRPLVLASADGADGMLVTPNFAATPIKLDSAADPDRPRERAVPPLPVATIPDLGGAGFRFTGASVPPTNPSAVVFSYEDAAANRVALCVTRNTGAGAMEAGPKVQDDHSVTWSHRGAVYALGGTPDLRRLTAIAQQLTARAADGPD